MKDALLNPKYFDFCRLLKSTMSLYFSNFFFVCELYKFVMEMTKTKYKIVKP
jgi:hypothetical protein